MTTEPYFIECTFCDHVDSLTLDRPIYPSEAIRLHERAIAHVRAHHSRARGRRLGVATPPNPQPGNPGR